jgi:hypothetical protein
MGLTLRSPSRNENCGRPFSGRERLAIAVRSRMSTRRDSPRLSCGADSWRRNHRARDPHFTPGSCHRQPSEGSRLLTCGRRGIPHADRRVFRSAATRLGFRGRPFLDPRNHIDIHQYNTLTSINLINRCTSIYYAVLSISDAGIASTAASPAAAGSAPVAACCSMISFASRM